MNSELNLELVLQLFSVRTSLKLFKEFYKSTFQSFQKPNQTSPICLKIAHQFQTTFISIILYILVHKRATSKYIVLHKVQYQTISSPYKQTIPLMIMATKHDNVK